MCFSRGLQVILSDRKMRKFITTHGEAIGALFAGAILIGLALYFRSNIEGYLGETVTLWVFWIVIGILVLTFSGWVRIRKEEPEDKRQQAEWQREEEQSKAEWDAFINWVRQHPVTDLNRLFDCLKAQRDLKEFGLDIGLPSQPKLDD